MINPVVYSISLDIYKIGSQKVLSMVRGDTKRSIVISLTENDRPYVIAEGCTAVFTAKKPDGNFIYNDCEIDFKNNTIIYNVTEQTTAVNGKVDCQLRLIGSNGGIISSPSFGMVVADLLYNEEPIVESSSEFNALTSYVAELQYKVENGDFNGKSIYVRGSVDDPSELDAKIPHAEAGDGYITGDDHLYVFDGTSFVDVGLVRGPQGLSGVYVGDGDMPEGYNVQIDPNGAVFEMDTELDLMSQNPVTNQAITYNFATVNNRLSPIEDKVSVIETDNIGRDNKIESLENQTENLFDSLVSVDSRVTEIEIKQIEHNKVLWENQTGACAGEYMTVPNMEKYHLFAVEIIPGGFSTLPRMLLYASPLYNSTYQYFTLNGSQMDFNNNGVIQVVIEVNVSNSPAVATIHEAKIVFSNGTGAVGLDISRITGIC